MILQWIKDALHRVTPHQHNFTENEMLVAIPITRDIGTARQCECGLWGVYVDGRLWHTTDGFES